jgi:hypothetical protein
MPIGTCGMLTGRFEISSPSRWIPIPWRHYAPGPFLFDCSSMSSRALMSSASAASASTLRRCRS